MSSVAQMLYKKSTDYGDLTALSIQGREISYNELFSKALSVAASLINYGASRETIAIVGQRQASSYFGILGILSAGCSYVPINPKYSKERLKAILRDAGVRFLVGDRLSLEMLEPVFSSQDMPEIKAIFLPEGVAPEGKKWVDESLLRATPPLNLPVTVSSKDLAYVLYTSGSTGSPKGVQVTNSNVIAFLSGMSDLYKLEVGFRASQTFDFSFDPSVSDMFFTWANGGVLCILPETELMLPHEFIVREKITFWNSVPAIAGFLNKMGYLVPGAFPNLTHSMFCGEQFPKYLADLWKKAAPNSTVENLYGPTEATIYISHYIYENSDEGCEFRNSIIPIGRAFPNHECVLIDENNNKVHAGEQGEIIFKGPQITKGYLNDKEKTSAVFVTFDWDVTGDTWYKTGDLGFYNSEGKLECIGRRDSQIKLGGRRVEIGEIESVLGRYPQTLGAVVVPLRDKSDVVTGCVAYITTKISKEEEMFIRQDSERFLERIFFPKKLFIVQSLPLTPSGKIDRKSLTIIAGQD
jgi:D-alanine--poly(phosphoribitol) ligase subunit 1